MPAHKKLFRGAGLPVALTIGVTALAGCGGSSNRSSSYPSASVNPNALACASGGSTPIMSNTYRNCLVYIGEQKHSQNPTYAVNLANCIMQKEVAAGLHTAGDANGNLNAAKVAGVQCGLQLSS